MVNYRLMNAAGSYNKDQMYFLFSCFPFNGDKELKKLAFERIIKIYDDCLIEINDYLKDEEVEEGYIVISVQTVDINTSTMTASWTDSTSGSIYNNRISETVDKIIVSAVQRRPYGFQTLELCRLWKR